MLTQTALSSLAVHLEIEVGGKSQDELVAELKTSNMSVSDNSLDIMSKLVWKPDDKETVKFARVKVSDLGFTENPTNAELLDRIRELGHSPCEPSDGPAIRLALKDQPRGDCFWCAMDQITDSVGNPRVFRVERLDDGEPRLCANWVGPRVEWCLGFGFVFRLRK